MRIGDWSSDVCSSDLLYDYIVRDILCSSQDDAVVAPGGRQTNAHRHMKEQDHESSLQDRSYRYRRSHGLRSEEHTSELQSLMRISYAVFCLKKKKKHNLNTYKNTTPQHRIRRLTKKN